MTSQFESSPRAPQLSVAFVRGRGLVRAGAMRKLASFVDEAQPHVMGVCDIESGDALALATRFALQWAYRGRQALFWKKPFRVHAVRDHYLPVQSARIFDRRGLLIVDAELSGQACTLAATQLSSEREWYVRELRFARGHLRGDASTLLFADVPAPARRFSDLGFEEICDGIFVRGFSAQALHASSATV
jgi:hypothetical protein